MKDEEWITGRVGLKVGDVPVTIELTVPAKPVKPHRMLPVMQQMASSCVSAGIENLARKGERVSCKPHCGACCRQPVPLSEIEVYQIAELVETMPEPRRSEIKERFRSAAEHFRSIGWFDRMLEQDLNHMKDKPIKLERSMIEVVLEYFAEGIACPFLEDESCSIYPNRPIVCREYLVTTPAMNCADPTAESVRRLELPIKPSNAAAKIGGMRITPIEGRPMLIRALELAEKYPESFEEKPGERWMAEFFGHLTATDPDALGKPDEVTPAPTTG